MDTAVDQPRRRRRGADAGKLTWLVDVATGDLADAIDRDLFADGRDFDELGWRRLWAYITTAPPGTAIFHVRGDGWSVGDKVAAENLFATEKLLWRYVARNFEGGSDLPYPQRVSYPGAPTSAGQTATKSWANASVDDVVVPPKVRELLRGA